MLAAMYHPTSRALAVLELLQTHRRISGADIAQRLGVDTRTVRRYIATLEDIGIPITAERGRHGAYLLVPGFKLPPMMFSDDEALALSLGLLAARNFGFTEASAAVTSAQAKLERVMPEALKQRMRAVSETVMLDLARSTGGDIAEVLITLSSAAQQLRRVHLGYRAAHGAISERQLDPYGLAHHMGQWYVVGHCHLRGGLRSFRLDRVTQANMLDAPFRRPPNFDAVAQLVAGIATLPRAHSADVELHTSLPDAIERLGGSMGLFEPVPEGVLLHAQLDDLDWFARQLARMPFGFRVVRSDGLREALGKLSRRLHDASMS